MTGPTRTSRSGPTNAPEPGQVLPGTTVERASATVVGAADEEGAEPPADFADPEEHAASMPIATIPAPTARRIELVHHAARVAGRQDRHRSVVGTRPART